MRKAFTLVEMLVVIAITAVLMAVLLPSLSQARERAIRLKCQSNVRNLFIGSFAYATDHKSIVPWGGAESTGSGGRNRFRSETRKFLFLNYGLGTPSLWYCPSSNDRPASEFNSRKNFNNPLYYTDDSANIGGAWGTGDREVTGYCYMVGPARKTTSQPEALRFSGIANPSDRIVWVDTMRAPGATETASSGPSCPVNTHATPNGLRFTAEGVHNVMADGHGEWRQAAWGFNTEVWAQQAIVVK